MMWRAVGSIVAGLVAWAVIATLLNFGLRLGIPGYVEAEPVLAFTLTMKIGRLLLAAIASIGAGAVVRAVSPESRWAPWIAGGIVLCLFLLVHVQIWNKFPVWYHLTFLLTIVPLFLLGASIGVAGRKTSPA